jgi:hypothetical protein
MRKILFESFTRRSLTESPPAKNEAMLAELAGTVDRAARRRLGRSLSIREVDAGSCNGCELEIHALNNAFYDLERFGLRFVASPRDARPEMGGRGRRLRRRRRHLRRQLCGRRRRRQRGAGRSAHPRLPALASETA